MSLADATRGTHPPHDTLIRIDGDDYLRIAQFDAMPPFLMSIPSACDLWMFLSSAGGLTAGRVSPDGSVFPYVTVDQLHDAHHTSGPITLLRVRRGDAAPVLWQPFAHPGEAAPSIERALFKNVAGDRVIFEEVHRGLGLAFRQQWAACESFGHVRTVTVANLATDPVSLDVLDGVRNVLPAGAPLALYQHSSSLVDAYKRTECDPVTKLAIFALTARITDRAEAAEMLRANVVWSHGLPRPRIALSLEAIAQFRRGESVTAETLRTGQRGHYLAQAALELRGGASSRWYVVLDANRTQGDVAALRARLAVPRDVAGELEQALEREHARLVALVASADGLQRTGDPVTSAHHFANVLFNCMRGGVFAQDHDVPVADLADFVAHRDARVAARHAAWFASLPVSIDIASLHTAAAVTGDADLERLAFEYLPLHFGRRHGDPSRPWNRFTIHVQEADGSRALSYEGNWRDIFQNWEALLQSFPAFLPGVIAKFVNASTIDGHNPYRITREGIDWEVEEPGEPWSNIGYWGDHQIIYLLKLLEASERTMPGVLSSLLHRRVFSYADVPYRIAPFEQMLASPRATIAYDHARAKSIAARVDDHGRDGRLLTDAQGAVVHATLFEKLLVPVLAKLSNLVPDAGIWMNTQRPEWNDANNALVGHGVSVVTLGYLRRHLAFLSEWFERESGSGELALEVADWMRAVTEALEETLAPLHAASMGEQERMALLRRLGEAYTDYRERVRTHGFSAPVSVPVTEAAALCRLALAHVDHALRANAREDGLYHSYNLLEVAQNGTGLRVHRLYEMLEGQVAALSSGLVTPEGAVQMLDGLFASALHRADQDSFLLYPARALPDFLDKNRLPEPRVQAIGLLAKLLAAESNEIVSRDASGTVRFHADLQHAAALESALASLAARPEWADAVARDRDAVLALYEDVFHHHAFTGRSGTMYGYEGIGSIYWHMVAKLLLAVQELHARAVREQAPAATIEALATHYERVRGGLGFRKSAAQYGAFPTDPYSHTPAHAGAQQPGMTGQVKEEILTRFGELGVSLEAGRIAFRPRLLSRGEFANEPAKFEYVALGGRAETLELPADALVFTYAQVPVVYHRTREAAWIRVVDADAGQVRRAGDTLDEAQSAAVLGRRGGIARIEVGIPETKLRD